MDIRRRRCHRMNLSALAIAADVCLHAKLPLIAFARLMHLRIARLGMIFRGTRRTDNTGIDDGAAGDTRSHFLQVLANRLKQSVAQMMALQQMAKLKDRTLVRHRLPAQIDPSEATHGPGFVQHFLCPRVRQVEPVLKKIDAQHPLQSDRWAAITGFGITGHNHCAKLVPRNHLVHLRQKLLAARRLAVALKITCGEGLLLRTFQPVMDNVLIIAEVRTYSELPQMRIINPD